MGCDIHTRAEVREAGVWRMVRRIWPDEYVDGGLSSEVYGTRSYYTFAILAGVRNYRNVLPIAEPRGWPDDLSVECQQEDNGENDDFWLIGGEHSFSWHSLRHLLEYPHWQATFTEKGVLNGPQYATMKKGDLPHLWWSVSEGRTLVDEDHLARELALGNDTTDLHVHMEWQVPYYKAAEEFVTEAIPRLLALASPHPDVLTMANLALSGEKTALSPLQDWLQEHDRPGLDDVRIVFCFDN
jgi:hypothetical protein